jgi:hypothetical protein
MAAVVALAVFLMAGVGLWQAFGRDEPEGREVLTPDMDRLAGLPEGWTDLGPVPREPTSSTVWTGTEILSWGGGGEEGPGPLRTDGFRFDPFSGEVATIPPAPLEPRTDPAVVWTGDELLVWGGWREGEPFFDDGAAYDPATDTWRALPPAPISARVPLSAWTGSEWILWGTGVRVDDRPLDGAAYDPSTDTWREIADGPIEVTDSTAMWTGQEFVVVGAALYGGNHPETRTAIGAAYDPIADSWRQLPASPLNPNSNTAVWTGERIVGVGYDHVTAAYDPDTNEWTEMSALPGPDCEGGLREAQSSGGWVVVSDCGTISTLLPGTTGWVVPEYAPDAYFAQTLPGGDGALILVQPPGGGEVNLWAFKPYQDEARMVTRFFPDFVPDGNERTMPVTFPNGATATLRYPYYFEIDALGAYPDVSWLWEPDPPGRHAIEFIHGAKPSVGILRGDGPVGEVVDATGIPRELWRLGGLDDEELGIVFELPEWTVVVPTGDFEPGGVAAKFTVTQDANRFPVVDAQAPFALSEEPGEGEGAIIGIGTIIIEPNPCLVDEVDTESGFASFCVDGVATISMYGVPTEYAVDIVTGTSVEDFMPAP